MAAQRPDIGVLRGGAGAHWAFAQVDLLKARPRGRAVIVEQRALRDRKPDGAFDITGDHLVAALESRIEPVEHTARLLAGVTRALESNVVAALLGDHAEAALDHREVLAILAEQQRSEAIVIIGKSDLRGGILPCRVRTQELFLVRASGAQWDQPPACMSS